ncbi:MAG: MazG-like family protein [Clostridia bacterium]|nr:MazG-like family protein [Clostridia bacterium]
MCSIKGILWIPDSELAARCAEKREEIKHEIADTYIYLLFLAHALEIDLDRAAVDKMRLNAQHYPADKEATDILLQTVEINGGQTVPRPPNPVHGWQPLALPGGQ